MTLQRIWSFTRRWAWLCVLAILLAGLTSYFVSSRMPRVYEGTAKLLVTPSQSGNGQASYNDVLTAERLTRTYSEVLKTRPIVEAGARQAGLNLPYERALTLLDVRPVTNTQLIQISARATDPELAARFANGVTSAFVDYTQASQFSRFAGGADLLTVVEPAVPATDPVQPNVTVNVALAVMLGVVVALALALAIEHLDDRLNSPERIARFTGLHLLGNVPTLPKDAPRVIDLMPSVPASGSYQQGTVGVAEMFRLLRANLQFAAVERPFKTLLVTSADAGDGKTTIAANLAVVLAQAGQEVLLVEADLRRPSLHDVFDVANHVGLTSLLINDGLDAATTPLATRVPGLRLLPSGPLPPNPSELLASERMRARLAELRNLADIVILDSPPVLAVSDPAILAGQVDGTLLVANSDRTRGQRAAQTVSTLQKAGAHLLGIILNRTRRTDSSYYAYDSRTVDAPQSSSAPSSAPTG